MAAPTLSWTLNTDRGTVSFGRLIPFAGNTYAFTLAGTVYGQTYTAYVMSEDGLTCLARSSYANGAYTIAFNGADLREAFTREAHELRPFHCFVRDAEKTVAEGDLTVAWNPLWTDTETGEAYTMRGPRGATGEQGRAGEDGTDGKSAYQCAVDAGFIGTMSEWLESLRGQPGLTTMVYCSEDAKWHPVAVAFDVYGKPVLEISPDGQEEDPDLDTYVTRVGAQSVAGVKTFTESPIVPEADKDDASLKAACTKWVVARIAAWWNSAKAAAQTITGLWTFSDLAATKVATSSLEATGAVSVKSGGADILKADSDGVYVGGGATLDGDVGISGKVTATGEIAVSGTETHSGSETHTGDETHNGTVRITGEFQVAKVADSTISFTPATQAATNPISVKDAWNLVALVAPYLNANWVYVGTPTLPEGYNGSKEGSLLTDVCYWREPGISGVVTGNGSANGLFGFITTEIEQYACYSPDYLKQVYFPNVTTVGKYAFYDADDLEAVNLPACTTIGESAFASAAALRSLTLPVLEEIGASAFNGDPCIAALDLPKCRQVGGHAFDGSFGSTAGTVDIDIGEDAELGTTSATYNTVGAYAFANIGTGKISSIRLPRMQAIGESAFAGQRAVTALDLSEVVTIGANAFSWFNYGKSAAPYQFDLALPKCEEIGSGAFSTVNSKYPLHSVLSLSAPLCKSVGDSAFSCQDKLAAASLPVVQAIGEGAFYNTALASLAINTVQTIGANAFSGCASLNDVYIDKTREEIAAMANFPFGRATASCRFHGTNGYVDGTGNFGL